MTVFLCHFATPNMLFFLFLYILKNPQNMRKFQKSIITDRGENSEIQKIPVEEPTVQLLTYIFAEMG